MGQAISPLLSTWRGRWMLVLGASAAIVGCGGGTVAGGSNGQGGRGGAGCSPGSEGCPCYGNNTCDAPLTCASLLCVNLGTGGSAGQGGSTQGGTFAGGTSSGGAATAGTPTGGSAQGGVSAGGASSGGVSGGNGGAGGSAPCLVGDLRTCDKGRLYGTCAPGMQSCRGDGTWSACTIEPAAADTCVAGNDDNCNGIPNEG
jgi:hypothetical protein